MCNSQRDPVRHGIPNSRITDYEFSLFFVTELQKTVLSLCGSLILY